jgi:uncharacterized membrane protein
MKTPASIDGHPIHAMLIAFPLGLFITGTVFDILTLITGSDLWRVLAFYTIAAGIIGGLAATVPGFIDYLSLSGRARWVATWHMAFNLAVMVLFGASFILRTTWGSQWVPAGSSLPQALTIIGAALLGISGWLGGSLVYKHGVGTVSQTRDDVERRRAA